MQKSHVRRTVLLQSQLDKAVFLLIFSCLAISPAFAACHAVTPSGSGSKTGADWNNAYAGLPATLIRGDVYYLADGNYPPYTFNTAVSGTTTVEIRKAQSYDNCTSTGWNASTMGSSQATFSGSPAFTISSSYLILNGNGQQTTAGCGGAPGSSVSAAPPTPADCGIKMADTVSTGIQVTGAFTNLTTEYVELLGNGNDSSSVALAEVINLGPVTSNTTWTHIYGHNAGCVYMQYMGNYRTVSDSYFWGTETGGQGGCHGQYSYDYNATNLTEFNNVYRDIAGTANWTFGYAGAGSGVVDTVKIYDNVFWQSPTVSWIAWYSDGIISCIANSGGWTQQCSNITLVQNSMVGLVGSSTNGDPSNTGINNDCTDGCGSGSSYTVENNIWYESDAPAFTTAAPATWTQRYNSCLNSGTCPSGTDNVTNTSSPNPFTNWTAGIFTLASDNASWNNRLSLGSPCTVDAAGNTFTTDRGAYQYISGAPQPPTSIAAIAH